VPRLREIKLGSWGRLLRADFRVTLRDVANLFGPADLILTSPPYCNARTYGAGVDFTLDDYAELGDLCFDALRPGGQVLMVLDAPVRKWRKGFKSERGFHPWRVMLDWADRVGFRVPDRLCYSRHGMPGEYRGRFKNDWEPLLWFEKPGGEPSFDKHAIAAEAENKNLAGRPTTGNKRDGVRRRRKTGWAVENDKKHRGTLWHYATVGASNDTRAADEAQHPARFPLRFAEDVVRCFSREGELVVDPFCGAGTSAAAALLNKRRFVGGDALADKRGEPWIDVARRRVIAELKERRG